MRMKETRGWLICFASIALLVSACGTSTNLTKIPTAGEARARVLEEGPQEEVPMENQYAFLKGGRLVGVKKNQPICVSPRDTSNKSKDAEKRPTKVEDTEISRAAEASESTEADKAGKDKKAKKEECKRKVKWGSILLDSVKAAQYATIKIQRNLLIEKLKEERIRRKAAKIIYDAALEQAKEKAKRTWWERNKGLVSGSVFFAAGIAATVGLVYALTGGSGAN